jgi:alkanesulfonate monooxygenase SsuD/methylene tetrahydromethanopterin reductase-like flavin-dependent oxidoreductase (luciferase family)
MSTDGMKHHPDLGIWLFPDASAASLVDAVVESERGGIDEVWIADEGVMREPSVVLAGAAMVTARIRLGVGITTPVLRHPGALGSTWATLDELSDGRAMLGLGVGGGLTLDPFGLRPERPVALVRDAIRTARAVIQRQHSDGYEVPAHAAPGRQVPIYVASKGEQINRLASREADGVFLSGFDLAHLDPAVDWARSVRPIRVALYASVRFRDAAPDDPTSLRGSPQAVAEGLASLIDRHRPESIGIALVDGDPLPLMIERALETFEHVRRGTSAVA